MREEQDSGSDLHVDAGIAARAQKVEVAYKICH